MKRLIAAGVIAAMIFAVSFTGAMVISSAEEQEEQKIEQIQQLEQIKSSKNGEEFYSFWEQKRELLAVFVNHEKIDEIGRLAAKMVSAERLQNKNVLFEAANEILFIIRGLKEDERLTLYTLL
jgi:hypothetical protein